MSRTLIAGILIGGLTMASGPWSMLQAGHGEGKGHHEEFSVDKKLERMTKDLSLTPEQQSSIRTILEEKKSRMDALHEQMKTIKDETHQKIQGVLNDEQKAKFESMKKDKGAHKSHMRK